MMTSLHLYLVSAVRLLAIPIVTMLVFRLIHFVKSFRLIKESINL